jgi:hypothetical protein
LQGGGRLNRGHFGIPAGDDLPQASGELLIVERILEGAAVLFLLLPEVGEDGDELTLFGSILFRQLPPLFDVRPLFRLSLVQGSQFFLLPGAPALLVWFTSCRRAVSFASSSPCRR